MKRFYLFCTFLVACCFYANAQTKFYGLTSRGGLYDAGTLFHFNKNTAAFTVDKTFKAERPGKTPTGQLANYGNGKFYAIGLDGGDNNSGVIFEWDSATNIYTKKYDFESSVNSSSPNGFYPTGSLALYNGKLYGMTRGGGTNSQGVIFEYDPTIPNGYTKVADFDGINGASPDGVLTLKDDLFYGVTSEGGANGNGVIFEFNPSTYSCLGKFSFGVDPADGFQPISLTLKDGKFYGITAIGGDGGGTLFEWDPAVTNGYTKKVNFNYSNGSGGNSSLTLKDGVFYGTTSSGANFGSGSIFEWDPATTFYTKKINLNPATGNSVSGPLTLLASGHLFGTTTFGGTNNHGAIFDFDPSTNNYTIKSNFSDAKGFNPQGFVLSNDKLFGLTQGGGNNIGGVLYEWDINTETYSTKIDLNYSGGAKPFGSLLLGTNGNIYGMTSEGGSYDGGVIFEVNSTDNTYTKKVDMQGAPRGNLIQSVNGKYYGVTTFGGGSTFGNIFEWDGSAKTVRDAHRFSYYDGLGYSPNGSLTEMNGKLYGMTQSGGVNDAGVLFEYDPSNDNYNNIFEFSGSNGSDPLCTLTGKDGILYGMTAFGGANNSGVVFKIDPAAPGSYTYIDFTGVNGSNPFGFLTFKGGKFYGMTEGGGTQSAGVIFEWDPANNFITVRYNFTGYDGGNPDASLTLGADGMFYGNTAYGGQNSSGVIFQWNPSSYNYTKLFDFGGDNGANPTGNLLIADNFCSTLPAAPTNATDPGNLTIAQGNSTTITVSGVGTIGWYSAATAGIYLGGGDSFTTPALETTTSFYAQDSTGCGASNSRTEITVTVGCTPTTSDTSIRGCSPYTWNGTAYTSSGTYTYPTTNAQGCDSTATLHLTIVTSSKPSTPASITGPTSVCAYFGNSTVTYSAPPITANTVTYRWTLPPNVTIVSATQDSVSITVSFAPGFVSNTTKIIKVKAAGCSGNSGDRSLTLSASKPSMPGPISGPADVCPFVPSVDNPSGTPVYYTISRVANAVSYNWTVPAGATLIAQQDDTSIIVSFSSSFVKDNIRVTAANGCGISSERKLTVSKVLPAAPGTIYGNATSTTPAVTDACPTIFNGSGFLTYAFKKVANAASYDWSFTGTDAAYTHITHPNGEGINDTVITVSFDALFTTATLNVKSVRPCGSSTARTLTITKKVPTTPVISGNASPCPSSTGVYTATSPTGSSYIWTVPSKTSIVGSSTGSSITVNFSSAFNSGSITAKAVSVCGTSAPKSFAVTKCVLGSSISLSVSEINQPAKPEIIFYPNPTNGQFKIALRGINNKLNASVLVEIENEYGQLVYNSKLPNSYGSINITMDNRIAAGVYMVHCIIDGKKVSGKIVVGK